MKRFSWRGNDWVAGKDFLSRTWDRGDNGRIWWLLTAGLIALAGGLAGWGQSRRGLFFWDEGLFLMSVRFIHWRIPQWITQLTGSHHLLLPPDQYPGFPVFIGKPGFVLLLSLLREIVGEWEWLGAACSGIFHAATTMLLLRWGGRRSLFAGLLAACIYLLSNYSLHYARTGLQETTAAFFALSSAFLVLEPQDSLIRRRRCFAGGFLLGVGITCSYRLAAFAFFLSLAFLLAAVQRRQSGSGVVVGCSVFAVGAVLPLALMEPVYRILFNPHYANLTQPSYFAFWQFKLTTETAFDCLDPLYYLRMLSRFEGPLYTVLVCTALAAALVFRRNRPTALLTALSLLFFSLISTRLTRSISMVTPLLALLLAFESARLAGSIVHRRIAVAVVILVSCLLHLPVTLQIMNLRSGYRQAVDYAMQDGEENVFSTMMPVMAFLLGRGKAVYPPSDLKEMIEVASHLGIRWLFIDWQKYAWYHPSIEAIESQLLPVSAIPNPYAEFLPILHENYLPQDIPAILDRDATLALIKIYDMKVIEQLTTTP